MKHIFLGTAAYGTAIFWALSSNFVAHNSTVGAIIGLIGHIAASCAMGIILGDYATYKKHYE